MLIRSLGFGAKGENENGGFESCFIVQAKKLVSSENCFWALNFQGMSAVRKYKSCWLCFLEESMLAVVWEFKAA